MMAAATKDPLVRKAITLPRSVWEHIADFRFAHRYNTEAEAVRQLILAGLTATARASAATPRPGGRAPRRRS
jgi:hypothetical protein